MTMCIGLVVGLGPPAQADVFTSDTPAAGWGVNGNVYATLVVGDTVYVGGSFSAAVSPTGQQVARANIAAFSMSSGALRTGWRADAGSSVRALAASNDSLYLGGNFGRVSGTVHRRLAKVTLATGAVDQGFNADLDSAVRAVELSGGDLYVGGNFLTANGVARDRLAKFNPSSGELVRAFDAPASGLVMGVRKSPTSDVLYVSGSFSTLAGGARSGVGAVDSTSGALRPTVFASSARPTLGLALNDDGSRLFGAGGASQNAAVAWSTTTGQQLWRQTTDGDIQAIAHHRDTVYFGFHDGFQSDTSVKLLAADAFTGQLQDFRPTINNFWGVYALDVSDAGVVAGGAFTASSGVTALRVARYLPSGGPPPSEGTTVRYLGPTDVWSYWDRGTRPAGWETSGFDGSTWPSGRPQLGFGDGDETTVLSRGPSGNRTISYYFRTRFTVDRLPTSTQLQLLADDGAVVYLNGVEVVRDNMPGGAITNGTRAASGRSGSAENALREFSVPVSALRIGSNTLAVEVHQNSSSSSDLGLDVNLFGQVPG